MKRIATLALVSLLFSLAASTQSKPKDVLGWEGTRWGMTAEEIAKLFGSRAERVPSVEVYGNGYYLYTVATNLKNQTYTAILVMDYATAKLSRVDVRLDQYQSPAPREDVFKALDAMLTEQYGAPDIRTDQSSSNEVHLSHVWKFQTSTVELWLYWDNRDRPVSSNVGISYYPTASAKS